MSSKIYNTRILVRHDITVNWEHAPFFVGLAGEIIVYDDRYGGVDENGDTWRVPGVKICDGITPLRKLPFIDDTHINDHIAHMTAEEHQMLKDHDYSLTWHDLRGDSNEEEKN